MTARPLPPWRLPLPQSLRLERERAWSAWEEAACRAGERVPRDPDFRRVLAAVLVASPFVAEALAREPALLTRLLSTGDLLRDYARGELAARAAAAAAGARDEPALMSALRRLRRYEMVRIAWRDLAGWAPLEEVFADLSELADGCIEAALAALERLGRREHGTPRRRDGRPMRAVVLGLGKLGGRELNFSSDVDLLVTYPEEGRVRGGRRETHEEHFARLARGLARVLGETTAEGFVFRTDLRLRPFGTSGPLALSFDALEEYYQAHGRDWERYALVRARPVAGDLEAGAALLGRLAPFVYRRYLDYGAFESLRELKAMIEREVARRAMQDDIKRGPGGIREIEFIVQTFQVVRGGREPALRRRAVLEALEAVAAAGHLPGDAAAELADAYRFLRRLEHRLQAVRDAQTHRLPATEVERARIAYAMGQRGWGALEAEIARVRTAVERHFEAVFRPPRRGREPEPGPEARLAAVWEGRTSADAALAVLTEAGYRDPEGVWRRLCAAREGAAFRLAGERGARLLERLVPRALALAAHAPRPEAALARTLEVLEAIAGRTAYLALLDEHPPALAELVRLCGASPWVAALLARHPLLLDELLDARALLEPLRGERLREALAAQLEGADPEDTESVLEALRHFKDGAVLRVAAADLDGRLDVAEVGEALTEIAEAVLERALAAARAHLERRHGPPLCGAGRRRREAGFAAIGYGKLGGRELSYTSDLDLVFLHDSAGGREATRGPRRIHNQEYFARLGQRLIHLLTAQTLSGSLYAVDVRLRPQGGAGLLVSGLDAFAAYQREEAWTWEHQALVRARPVAGAPAVAEGFRRIRHEVLTRARDPEALRREVAAMRARMRRELDRAPPGRVHLKHGRGGIVDVEFMVQYAVLRWAGAHPSLTGHTGTLPLIEALAEAGVVGADEVDVLRRGYRACLAKVQRLTLEGEDPVVDAGVLADERGAVAALWRAWMEAGDEGGAEQR